MAQPDRPEVSIEHYARCIASEVSKRACQLTDEVLPVSAADSTWMQLLMTIDPQQEQAHSSLKAGIQCCVDRVNTLDVEQEQMRKQIDLLQEQLTTATAHALSGEKCGWPNQIQMPKGDSFENEWMTFGAFSTGFPDVDEVTQPKEAQSPIVTGPRTVATFGSPFGSFASPSGVPPSPGWLLDSPGEFVPPPPGLGLLENALPISLSMAIDADHDDDAGRGSRFQSPKPHQPRRQPLGTPASPFLTPTRPRAWSLPGKITPSMRSPTRPHAVTAMESPFAICESGGSVFSFTTRVANDSFLGLEMKQTDSGNYLKVTFVDPGGAMHAWNKQCIHGPASGKAVMPGDTIVRVNNATTPAEMLEECREKWLLRFTVQRDQVGDDLDLMSAALLLTP